MRATSTTDNSEFKCQNAEVRRKGSREGEIEGASDRKKGPGVEGKERSRGIQDSRGLVVDNGQFRAQESET